MKKFLLGLIIGLSFIGISAHALSTYITTQGGTGTTTPSGILYGDNGATNSLKTVRIGSNLTWDGTTLSATGGSGSPGGSNGQLQYNATGSFGGVSTTTLVAGSNVTLSGTPVILGSTPITISATGGGSSTFGTTSISALYPLSWNTSTAAMSLLFGTTTSNTWAGLQSFSNIGLGTSTTFSLINTAAPTGVTNLSLCEQGTTGSCWALDADGGYFYLTKISDAGATSTSAEITVNPSGFLGIASTTPGSLLSLGSTNGINFSTATSSFSSTGGINLSNGCFAVGGTCISGGGGSVSGTTGQIAYLSGTNTAVGTSTIFINTAGQVGIGTTSPASNLTIQGTAGQAANLFTISSSTNTTLFNVGPSGNMGMGGSQGVYTFNWDNTNNRLAVGNLAGQVSPSNMTSNSLPVPYVASASGATCAAAYLSFAGPGSAWCTSWGNPRWLQLDFGSPTLVSSYQFSTSNNNFPRTWTIQGSNDNSTWTIIDSQNVATAANQTYSYTLSQNYVYRYYRFNVTANNGDGNIQIFNLIYNGNTNIPTSKLHIFTTTSAEKGFVIQGATSQTADLFQWLNSSGTVLGNITAGGNLGIGTSTPPSLLTINPTSAQLVSTNPVFLLGTSTLASASANGTYIGVNAPTGFSGNVINYQQGGNNIFRIDNTGRISSSVAGSSAFFDSGSGGTTINPTGGNPGGSTNVLSVSTQTSMAPNFAGTWNGINMGGTFAPTLNTTVFNSYQANTTINQTGVSSGITRGLYITPTITSARDYRAIETAPYVFNINLATTTLVGNLFNPFVVASTSARTITNAVGTYIPTAPVAQSNITISTSTALLIGSPMPTIGATTTVASGGTVTTAYGAQIFAPVGASTNYALQTVGTVNMQTIPASGVGDTYICVSTAGDIHTGATCAASTIRIKENVLDSTMGLSTVMSLRPVTFNYKTGFYGGKKDIGFIAEEAAKVDSRLALYDEKGQVLNVNERGLISVAVKGIQDLFGMVQKLAGKVSGLEAKVDAQQKQIDALQKQIDIINSKIK